MQEVFESGLLIVVAVLAAVLQLMGVRPGSGMTRKQKTMLWRILAAALLLLVLQAMGAALFDRLGGAGRWVRLACYLADYAIIGHDILKKAVKGIRNGQVFDENFLMAVATLGALALAVYENGDYLEAIAVMLFYQVGEWFQSYAVGKSRKSIADMMDIAPEYANLQRDGKLEEVDPYDVEVGDTIVIKPGERVPLDGVVLEGSSQLDTAALTGESIPRVVGVGAKVISGCINKGGVLTVRVEKPYGESTVQRILELVEEASERKARTENFITRFARYYTPIVVGLALVLALIPPLLFGQPLAKCVESALIFLVVSCPCALVISVPLSFFGGIGAASKIGVLVKGSSYLETLGGVQTVVFDKTGTLTNGVFTVVAVHPGKGVDPELALSYAAHAEAYSTHPIALSLRESYSGVIDRSKIDSVEERSGQGVSAVVDSHTVLVGNGKLMEAEQVPFDDCELVGTILHVAIDGDYAGHIVIADVVKEDAKETIARLHAVGVKKCVMLTGDREEVAAAVARELGIDEYRAQCLPADKVHEVERLLAELGAKDGADEAEVNAKRPKLAFVGDGINDAPVLMRADIGIAMGGMGSDAAIEAADVVLMEDEPSKIATTIAIARKTMRIVWQNIIFAIGVKVLIMILALPFIGLANMWLAVFGDVGVACIAILNAMRALRVR